MELTYLTEPNCSFRVHWGPLIIPTAILNIIIINVVNCELTNLLQFMLHVIVMITLTVKVGFTSYAGLKSGMVSSSST